MQETSEWYGDDDWAVDSETVSDEIAEENNNANDRTNAERQQCKRHDGGA